MSHNILLLIKSIGYRIFATLATIIISFIFTKSIKISISIGLLEVISKIVLYFMYEKIWENLNNDKKIL